MELTLKICDQVTGLVKSSLPCSSWTISEDAVGIANSQFKFPKNSETTDLVAMINSGDFIHIPQNQMEGSIYTDPDYGFTQKITSITEDKKEIIIKTQSMFSIFDMMFICNYERAGVDEIYPETFVNLVINNDTSIQDKLESNVIENIIAIGISTVPITVEKYPYEVGKLYTYRQIFQDVVNLNDGNSYFDFYTNFADNGALHIESYLTFDHDTNYPTINLEEDYVEEEKIVFTSDDQVNKLILYPEPTNAYSQEVFTFDRRDDTSLPVILAQGTYSDDDYNKDNTLETKASTFFVPKDSNNEIQFNLSDPLYPKEKFKLYRKFNLLWRGKTIQSRLTGFSYTDNFDVLKLKFGYDRLNLTNKVTEIKKAINDLTIMQGKVARTKW